MNTGEVITNLRGKKAWSRTDLAKVSSVSSVMIGKYERNEAVPSLEVAKKIADAFNVSLDYLVGEGQNVSFDKKMLNRLKAIDILSEKEKSHIMALLDAFLRDSNAKKLYI
jgi:transcriptional regulator with XRE-family HTH domain